MGRGPLVALLALLGLLCAAGMGYAAYVVSRDSVAVPATRLQEKPATELTPAQVRAKPERAAGRQRPRPTTTVTTRTTTHTTASPPVTTVDDRGGRSGNSGSGSGDDNSGRGGGGRGGDDD